MNSIMFDFWNSLYYSISEVLDKCCDELVRDSADWVYVDGEEGDYGVIRYYLDEEKTQLVCEEVHHSGDQYETNFTELGTAWCNDKLIAAIKALGQV